MVIGVLVGTATVTTQGLTASLRHDETKSGDFHLAKTGDLELATSGDFFMATDSTEATALGDAHSHVNRPFNVLCRDPDVLKVLSIRVVSEQCAPKRSPGIAPSFQVREPTCSGWHAKVDQFTEMNGQSQQPIVGFG